jgi:hypothetical protein
VSWSALAELDLTVRPLTDWPGPRTADTDLVGQVLEAARTAGVVVTPSNWPEVDW